MLKDRVDIEKCTLTEKITSAILSGLGAAEGIAIIVLCIVISSIRENMFSIVTGSIFGAGVFLFFIMNTMYHSLTADNAKRVFLILSNCMLHLAILGINCVYFLAGIGGAIGWIMFGVSCAIALVPIVFSGINLNKFKFVSFMFSVVNLWLSVLLFHQLIIEIGIEGFVSYIVAQMICTFASLFYVLGKKFDNMHIIFHVFSLLGIAIHFLTIYYYM